jgi:hypothetical protein
MLKSVDLFPCDTDWRCKRRTWRGSKNARCYTVSGPDVSVYADFDMSLSYIFFQGLNFLTMSRTPDKTISNLEMELASARATQESMLNSAPSSESEGKRKYFMVIGINTAFSSRKRRDSVRATWMPQGGRQILCL